MSKLVFSLFLTTCLLHSSTCAELGLEHRQGKVSEVNEEEHLKVFNDGFMLDDEDFEEGKKSTLPDTLTEEIIPMLDPEADSG